MKNQGRDRLSLGLDSRGPSSWKSLATQWLRKEWDARATQGLAPNQAALPGTVDRLLQHLCKDCGLPSVPDKIKVKNHMTYQHRIWRQSDQLEAATTTSTVRIASLGRPRTRRGGAKQERKEIKTPEQAQIERQAGIIRAYKARITAQEEQIKALREEVKRLT